MSLNPLERVVDFVTEHSRATVALMLVLSVVAGFGATMIQPPADQQLASNSTEQQKLEYISSQYDTGRSNVTATAVYVRDTDGNVLSKEALIETLRYERAVTNNSSVSSTLASRRGITSVAGLVSMRLAGEPTAGYDQRLAALRSADAAEVRAAVTAVLGPGSEALALMPASYEPGTATAESTRIVFRFRDSGTTTSAAQQVLYDNAQTETTADGRAYFMLTGPAQEGLTQKAVNDNLEFVGPVALVLILVTLAFAYRDVADVLVGMFGVVLTLVWMFGLLGWLGVPFGQAAIIAPILLIGLSIDYGIHVFMRYREEREAGRPVRLSMRHGLAGVGVALTLVTVTTATGFLSNLTNSLATIRQLALATSLGVVAALVVFVTIVPALKVELDVVFERLGLDRTQSAIGSSSPLVQRFLTVGVSAARGSAILVVVGALVVGTAGAYAWTDLDRSLSTRTDEPADWKQELPEPVGIEEWSYVERLTYVESNYRADGSESSPSQILIEGDIQNPATLERIHTATEGITDSDAVYRRNDGSVPTRTPVTVMQQVAAEDEEFAEVYQRADTDGDDVPDRNLETVYDALFDAAPARAGEVIEREDGEYRSMRMVVPMHQRADANTVAAVMRDGAAAIEGDGHALTATATGDKVVLDVQGDELLSNLLVTLVVSLLAILVLLSAIYYITEGRATLGVVTVLPVALVVTWVLGAMWVLSVPLTLFTALMMSLSIGLGIDYSIHITDRFADEFNADTDVEAALETAVTGTGGALLGSTATTVGAFGTLALATFPFLRQLGTMVGLALVLSFVAAVFVLPSLLLLWARLVDTESVTDDDTVTTSPSPQD